MTGTPKYKVQNNKNKKIKNTGIDKYNLQKCRNTNNMITEIKVKIFE